MATLVRPQVRQQWLDPGPISGATNDRAYVLEPRLGITGGPAMIWCHGALLSATSLPGTPVHEFLGRLCSLGVTVVAPDLGNGASGPGSLNGWASTVRTARMEAWRVWMDANLACDASAVHLAGFSMGGSSSLGYVRDYPSKVLSTTGWLPAIDVKAIHDATVDDPMYSLKALVDAAYGVGADDPLPAGADPYVDTSLHGIKWRGYYANLPGAMIPTDWCTRMAAWTGGQAIPVPVASHTMDALLDGNTDFDEWVSWSGIAA